jgi:uncharacterized protein with FMN-binding domain
MSKKKGCLTAIIATVILMIILIATAFIQMGKSAKSYDTFNYSDLDLSRIDDGTYTGSEDGNLVKATVEVTVKDHKITNVTIIKHECGTGKPAEVIVNDIVEENSLDVDTISGATMSSNVIKVAVYNALITNMK